MQPRSVTRSASSAHTIPSHSSRAVALCVVALLALGSGCGSSKSSDPATSVTLGGSVTGLAGSGLVLHGSQGEDLAVSANGPFAFPTGVALDSTYAVTVKTQPSSPTQICTVTGGTGTVLRSTTINVQVACETVSFAIGGTVSGLTGSGLVLQSSAGEDLAVTGNGSIAFLTPILSGTSYAVTVKTHPSSPTQVCSVTGGTGTVGGGPVTNVVVSCLRQAFSVGGTVAGLAGSGLVLQDNLGDDRAIVANGGFSFATPILSDQGYSVTVKTQPTMPTQLCSVTDGTGTVGAGDVSSVAVSCVTQSFHVGGTVSGLAGAGLVLQNALGDDLPVAAGSGSFTFATTALSGAGYAVTVKTQPSSPTQLCTVTGGTGTVGGGDVSSVAVSCATQSFTVGGTISGLTGGGLVLRNNLGDDLGVAAGSGSFTFATTVLSGAGYAVTVKTQPSSPSQVCTVTGGTGTVGGGPVAGVVVSCVTQGFTVSGTVSGLKGSGLVLQNNLADDRAITANGPFTFANTTPSGAIYAVTVKAQPSSPTQACTVMGGTGTVGNGPVTTVVVSCVTQAFGVNGTVSGLTGTGLVLQNNLGDDLAVLADGPFSFATAVASGGSYSVTVKTQPTGQVSKCRALCGTGTGTVEGSDVNSVVVMCGAVRAWGPAQRIETAGNTYAPQFAFDGTGSGMAIWRGWSGSREDIRANRFSSGTCWGTAQLIENGTVHATDPHVAVGSSGDVLAVWNLGTDVWANHYGSTASAWGTAQSIETVAGTAYYPRVAMDANGNGIAVWLDGASSSVLWSSRYTAGSGWGTPQVLSTATVYFQAPQVAIDAAGNAIAVWNQQGRIWSSRYTAGSGWGTSQAIDPNATSSFPQVAFDGKGNAVAVWDVWNYYTGTSVWSNRYTAGSGWGTAQAIDSGGNSSGSHIAFDGKGNALAVWVNGSSIMANRYTVGSGWGTAQAIGTGIVPQVAADAAGNAFAVWVGGSSIMANRYTAGSGWGTAQVLSSSTAAADSPQVALDTDGNAIAVWSQPISGQLSLNIWSSRFE